MLIYYRQLGSVDNTGGLDLPSQTYMKKNGSLAGMDAILLLYMYLLQFPIEVFVANWFIYEFF